MALPEVRAAFLKEAIQSFAALGPAPAAAALARVPANVPRDILRARALDWLPASHALAILRAIEAEGGLEAVRRCSAAAIERTFSSPLLRAFLEAAVGLGAGPSTVVRSAVLAWPLHYRSAGELVLGAESAPEELRVLHPGIPDLLREPCWLTSLATCIARVAAVAVPETTAEVREDRGRIVYVVRWARGRAS